MAATLWLFLVVYLIERGVSLVVSARHELAMRRRGAVEIARGASRALLGTIATYGIATIVEGELRQTEIDALALIGIAIVVLSQAALVVLNRALGGLWTAKVLIAPDHRYVRSPLFERFRHPIYLFVLIPEWIGLGLAMHAWVVMAVGLPILLILLFVRTRAEERALHTRFADYRGFFVP